MIPFKRTFRQGAKGGDVRAVKRALRRLRAHPGISGDNVFGANAVEGLRRFQRTQRIKADGVYGPATHGKLEPHFDLYSRWLYRRYRVPPATATPFPGGWTPNRLDMGFDGTFYGELVAPFDGTVTYVTNWNPSWRGGIIQFKADHRPKELDTDTIYFAEGVRATVPVGRHVKAGEKIGEPWPSGWGNAYGTTWDGRGQIEWGPAGPGAMGQYVNTLAIDYGLGSYRARAAVLRFAAWAESLGMKGPTQTWNAGNA